MVYPVCYFVYIFWTHVAMVNPRYSDLRMITTIFSVTEFLGFLRYSWSTISYKASSLWKQNRQKLWIFIMFWERDKLTILTWCKIVFGLLTFVCCHNLCLIHWIIPPFIDKIQFQGLAVWYMFSMILGLATQVKIRDWKHVVPCITIRGRHGGCEWMWRYSSSSKSTHYCCIIRWRGEKVAKMHQSFVTTVWENLSTTTVNNVIQCSFNIAAKLYAAKRFLQCSTYSPWTYAPIICMGLLWS